MHGLWVPTCHSAPTVASPTRPGGRGGYSPPGLPQERSAVKTEKQVGVYILDDSVITMIEETAEPVTFVSAGA